MKTLLAILALILAAPVAAQNSSAYDSLTLSTNTGRARRSTSGYVTVSSSSANPTLYTIILDGTKGGVNASSGTFVYGVKAATGAFSGAVSASSFSATGTTIGSGGIKFPDSTQQSSAGAVLAATQTWSGANTFLSTPVVSALAPVGASTPTANSLSANRLVQAWGVYVASSSVSVDAQLTVGITSATFVSEGVYIFNWQLPFTSPYYFFSAEAETADHHAD